MFSALRRWRRRQAADRMIVSPETWATVEARLPILAGLPDADKVRLRRMALEFLAEKEVAGAAGLIVDDLMLLSIALQACLLILHRGLAAYEGWVGIVIYPGDFMIAHKEVGEDGVVHEYDKDILGQAWHNGPVVLSWNEDEDETDMNFNVVVHEFAHKLDMLNGAVDGLPELPAGMRVEDWAAAFGAAYEDFCRRVDDREETELDPYGAENPGEFFAVMSEAFFGTPDLLRDEYPAVYDQLAAFYGIDPMSLASSQRKPSDITP
jgi:Mlc titration factor MtfA (ptsG expression regulator)